MDMTELLRLLGLRQAYDAYQRNIGQPVANVAGPFGRGFLGLQQPEYGSEEAYRTGQAVGNMPGPNVPAGAIKMAAQVPGLLDAIQAAKNSPELTGLLGLTAYHGSPYRFSRFDPTKIGSGEGRQSYGYGTYFAEAPETAKSYQQKLSRYGELNLKDGTTINVQDLPSNSPQQIAGQIWINNPNLMDAKYALGNLSSQYLGASKADVLKELEKLNEKGASLSGMLYTVDIPDEMIGKMLDWDKPLGQQPQLKVVLEKIGKEISLPKMQDAAGAGFAYGMLANAVGGPKNASALLREYGIPGVAYLDQGSRGAGQGTRNFVVFPGEEEAIKMLKVE